MSLGHISLFFIFDIGIKIFFVDFWCNDSIGCISSPGEHEAAIQQGGLDDPSTASPASLPHPCLTLLLLLLFLLLYLPSLTLDLHSQLSGPISFSSSFFSLPCLFFLPSLYVFTQFFSTLCSFSDTYSSSYGSPSSCSQTAAAEASRCPSALTPDCSTLPPYPPLPPSSSASPPSPSPRVDS